MVKKGLVRKEETHVSGGKRALRIYLTEEGERLAQVSSDIVEATNAKALEGFTPEEIELFKNMLKRFTANLNE